MSVLATNPAAVQIRLQESEMQMATMLACMRRVNGILRDRSARNRAEINRAWEYDCVGALGECVLAKAFNIFWNGSIGNLLVPDVGPLQVRASSYLTGERGRGLPFMGMNPDDKDDDPYFQVIGPGPIFWITGWLYGSECKQPEWWGGVKGNRRECFKVPWDALRPVTHFPGLTGEIHRHMANLSDGGLTNRH